MLNLNKDNKSCENLTQEELQAQKQMRTRKAFRTLAILVALYYFGSAFYSYYQERQLQEQSTTVENTIVNPQVFRDNFNKILNTQDTSLPTANGNDTTEGFVSVLSPAVEIRGFAQNNTRQLHSVQIQTRYEGAMPPESVIAFRTFVATCENDPSFKSADEILNALGFIPEFDKNEDNKVFTPTEIKSRTMLYKTTFVGGQIDELTLVVSPL